MARASWITLVLGITLGLAPFSALAADEAGMEQTDAAKTGPADTAVVASDASTTAPADAPTDVPPAPAAVLAPDASSAPIPALKPIVITFSGELSAVDANTAPAAMTVQDRYGVRKEIAVPAEAKISQGSVEKTIADLNVGDKLTVEYTYDVATGKRTAQSINIGEAAAPKPAAAQ